jgi:hypothetical protein
MANLTSIFPPSEWQQVTSSQAAQFGYVDSNTTLPQTQYGTGMYAYQAQLRDDQRQLTRDQFAFSQQMTAASYSAQIGSASSLQRGFQISAGGFAVNLPSQNPASTALDNLAASADKAGGSLTTLADVFAKSGFLLDKGDGRSLREVEEDNIRLQREQQQHQIDQSGRGLGLQEDKMSLALKHFYERIGLQREQMEYGYNYQSREMDIRRGQEVEQERWQNQNWSFQRSQSELGFAWQMEDYDLQSRYARGMDRRILMRNQERSVIQHAMSMSQSDVERGRMEMTQGWSAERYDRDKAHFEQTYKFQEEALEMQIRHFEESRALEEEKMAMQRENHALEIQWLQERWANEDQYRTISLQLQDFQMEMQVEFEQKVFETQEAMRDLQMVMDGINMASSDMTIAFRHLVATSQALPTIFTEIDTTLNGTSATYQTNVNSMLATTTSFFSGVSQSISNAIAGIQSAMQQSQSAAISNAVNNLNRHANPLVSSGLMSVIDQTVSWADMMSQAKAQYGNNWLQNMPTGNYQIAEYYDGGYVDSASGYTGDGGKFTPAGIVHGGEYVIPQQGSPVIRGDNPETTALLSKMVALLEKIVEMGPGRVNATINTSQGEVSTQSLFNMIDEIYKGL